jgi:hypothetical protein
MEELEMNGVNQVFVYINLLRENTNIVKNYAVIQQAKKKLI